MRLTDRSLWTAPPPNAVRQATAQPVSEQQGLATYYYFLVAHYPIGNVISQPFPAYRAPNTLDAQNYVFLSWEAAPTATSYDILRSETLPLPTDPTTPIALALGVTSTTFNDQGAALSPYNFAGLMNGSPVDAWALLNNKDYSKPVLEFSPTVRITSILFSDGSELATASGGGSAVVTGINGVQGTVTLAQGPNASITTAGSTITVNATPAGSNQQIQFNNAGALGAANVTWNSGSSTMNVNGSFTVNGVPVGSQIPTGATPPASPQEGQLWYNTSTLRLAIFITGAGFIQIA